MSKVEPAVKAVVEDKPAEPLKLDFGCGKNKVAGFHGVDAIAFEGVDTVMDVRQTPWPWGDESVAEVHTSHFVEHLTGDERVTFFNELYRVMEWGAKARVIVPSWAHDRAYGDPTHKWPPCSGWMVLYYVKSWRDVNAPHTGYTCDFDWESSGSWDQWLEPKNMDLKVFAMTRYVNSTTDLIFTLTKTKRA
jgi:hypothetical protein